MSHKKKSNKESFSLLPTRVIVSQKLNSLNVNSRWLYVVLTTGWKRGQDERKEFIFTYKQLRQITHFSYNKIRKCLIELEQAGFIFIQHGRLCNKPNKISMNLRWLHQYSIDNPEVAIYN